MKNRGRAKAQRTGAKPKWLEEKEKADTEKAREKNSQWFGSLNVVDDTPAPMPEEFAASFDFQMDERLAESFKQLGVTAKEASRMMGTLKAQDYGWNSPSWSKAFPRKRITDVWYDSKVESVDVTTWEDPVRKTVIGQRTYEFFDQDSQRVPPALEALLLREMEIKGNLEDSQRILAEWNSGPIPDAIEEGHLESCIYRGTNHFACTCAHTTVFGETYRWFCSCCERPVADDQFGLCEMCKAHEYSSPETVEMDHQRA